MSKGSWDIIKRSKRFYIRTFRRTSSTLIVSTAINVALLIGIYYSYFSRPQPDFYATDGVTPPIFLTAMDEPNNTSMPMLANDQAQDDNNRVIPK